MFRYHGHRLKFTIKGENVSHDVPIAVRRRHHVAYYVDGRTCCGTGVMVELLALTLHGSDWLQVSVDRHQSAHTSQRTSRIALDFKVSHDCDRICGYRAHSMGP